VYKKWCEKSGEREKSKRSFGMALRERGFTDSRKGQARVRHWSGIALIDPMADTDDDSTSGHD
jgi:phage/plasmid-associated DNA primase